MEVIPVEEAVIIAKRLQDELRDCKFEIFTYSPCEKGNRENALLFGRAGVVGKWIRKKQPQGT